MVEFEPEFLEWIEEALLLEDDERKMGTGRGDFTTDDSSFVFISGTGFMVSETCFEISSDVGM